LDPYKAYQQNRASGQTRIDTTVALYEAIIERLEKALAALRRQDEATTQKQLGLCHLGIAALASAFDPRAGELAVTLHRLFDFTVRCLRNPTVNSIEAALNVFRTLHEAFQTIRPEAVQMERSGAIPPLDQLRTFQATA
jgi:flagellar biosynthetic protein FliS